MYQTVQEWYTVLNLRNVSKCYYVNQYSDDFNGLYNFLG